MSYAIIVGAAVSVYAANRQQKAASDGAFWAGAGGGGGIFQGDFNVNLGGSGIAYQSAKSGSGSGGLEMDPVMVAGLALVAAGFVIYARK